MVCWDEKALKSLTFSLLAMFVCFYEWILRFVNLSNPEQTGMRLCSSL